MSDINKIYEITSQLSSPDNLRNDFKEIINFAAQHFNNKYLSPINTAIASRKAYCFSHPCRETNLLKAFKPFAANDKGIDELINMINTLRIFSEIYSKPKEAALSVSAAAINDTAIHSDGIYEIDEGCLNTATQAKTDNDILALEPITLLFLIALVIFN